MTPQAARQAGYSVIPIGANKKPLLNTWKPFQSRFPTDHEFMTWLKLNPPLWAFVTGAISRVVCLDFDGESGRQTLEKLGLKPHRSTPSGGFHVDFLHPGWYVKTLNSKSKRELGIKWPGLDIRADGGYVIFHGRTAAGAYEWLREAGRDEL
jgi:hypothetical protein